MNWPPIFLGCFVVGFVLSALSFAFGIVDMHVHFMPDRVMRKVWAYFDAAGPLTGRTWPIRYRWSDEDRLDQYLPLSMVRLSERKTSFGRCAFIAERPNTLLPKSVSGSSL